MSASTSSPGASSQEGANPLAVAVGKTILVDFAQPIKRMSIGLNDVAEANVTSPTEVLVSGKAPGQTTLIVWQRNGERQFFDITVRPDRFLLNDRLEAVRRELNAELPGQPIKLTAENGTVFLRGTVRDLASSDRAVQIASNTLAPETADSAAKLGASPVTTNGNSPKVINLLYVQIPAAEKQILLKVRFASLDRTRAKQLGLNLVSLGAANTVGGITTGQFSPPSITSPSTGPMATFSNELNILALPIGNLPFGADIEALQSEGVVQLLAQPNLLASSGKQASFLAGGEYPYPVAQGTASGTTITIMFKEYGIRLNFIPTVTPRGTIRLQVAPEVSSLDFTNAVSLAGFLVPAISSRKVRTEVELAEDQSFVIGGLLDNRETQTFQKIPFLGDVPVLGKFFQSISKSRSNTELIVVVTPEIVDPISAGEPSPELKFPAPFLPPNSTVPLQTPQRSSSAPKSVVPETIPIEKLLETKKPTQPLIVDGGFTPSASSSAPPQQ